MSTVPHVTSVDRCPDHSWGILWGCAAIVFFGLTGAMECLWRSKGHVPSVPDSARLWTWTRDQVASSPRESVVILGDSRAQLGIDIELARKTLNRPVWQLAIAGGGSPLAALEELAEDKSFSGEVIATVVPGWFELPAELHQKYVSLYQSNTELFDGFETRASSELASVLVVKRPACNLRHTLEAIAKRRIPIPDSRRMDINRQIHADFSKVNVEKLRADLLRELHERRGTGPVNPNPTPTWHSQMMRYVEAAQAISKRGGQVVFVYMPISGPRVASDEETNPRALYWDVFAQAAKPFAQTIHFEDFEDLRTFECPDMSHLDAKDAGPFTAALLKHIEPKDAKRGQK